MNNNRRKEQVFDQPLLTDQADDEVVRTPSTSQIPEEPRAASPPVTTYDDMETHDMEIERLRSIAVTPLPTIPNVTIQTTDLEPSPGDHGSNMETPTMSLDEGTFQENFGFSNTNHLMNSADEELHFQEVEFNQ
ncbi:sister chromatid cohesion 1 protein 3-like [Senna tora]|uniref:Sister chromatid cohesion 1 protein 3-like n=1 Tax=Senna tora TaxID=362788 RepID=A0A834W3M9_9FABA|nr:sister chromatid cohesion 1 protein 3-like [Senna tora]